ncbi:unnamed protein product [Oikopleura dioica]|uniref:Apple domain-containing protein n=2 Tax=Oikopleura dioica TaxID=34765 RepID=E4Y3D2_OIKDI|nr:unnamed protein product [Oikopleura dioica]
MRVIYFAYILEAVKAGPYYSYFDYAWLSEAKRPYEDSPCFSGEHSCHQGENCVPEGQHLYQCCDYGWYTDAHCRQGNPHPCLDKNTCSDGEFCHRLVKPNEDTHDYECIDKDNDCIGMTMCQKFYQGSCAANNKNKNENKRLAVTSLEDCYAECKNEKKCKGFDLDSKGGCVLAFQDCRPEDLVLHPIYDDKDDHGKKSYWVYFFGHDKKQLSYTYYPMSGCSTPERSSDCDKNLVDHIEDLYFEFLAHMEKKSAAEHKNEEASDNFRQKVTLLVTIFGSILVVLAFVFVVYRISVNQKTVDPGVQMTSTAPPDNSVPDHAITGIAVDPFCGD